MSTVNLELAGGARQERETVTRESVRRARATVTADAAGHRGAWQPLPENWLPWTPQGNRHRRDAGGGGSETQRPRCRTGAEPESDAEAERQNPRLRRPRRRSRRRPGGEGRDGQDGGGGRDGAEERTARTAGSAAGPAVRERQVLLGLGVLLQHSFFLLLVVLPPPPEVQLLLLLLLLLFLVLLPPSSSPSSSSSSSSWPTLSLPPDRRRRRRRLPCPNSFVLLPRRWRRLPRERRPAPSRSLSLYRQDVDVVARASRHQAMEEKTAPAERRGPDSFAPCRLLPQKRLVGTTRGRRPDLPGRRGTAIACCHCLPPTPASLRRSPRGAPPLVTTR